MSRTCLTEDRTYSVPTDFATPQIAYDTIRDTLDFCGKTVRVNVADGTYGPLSAQGKCVGQIGPKNLVFSGNTKNPAECVISATESNSLTVDNGAELFVQGFEFHATGPIPYGFGVLVGDGKLCLGINFWRSCQNGFFDVGNPCGILTYCANQAIFSSSNCVWVAEAGGRIFANGTAFYFYSAPHFAGAVVLCDQDSFIDFSGATFPQEGGAVTGLQYNISSDAKIILGGATIPGSGHANDGTGIVQQ